MNRKTRMILICAALGFIILAVLTVSEQLQPFNAAIASGVQSLESAPLTAFFATVANIGEWFVYTPIAALLLLLPKTRSKAGIPAAVTLAASATLNHILKLCFAVPRPDAHRLISAAGYSFPSGHAMNGTAFIGICVILFMRSSYKRAVKLTALAAAVVFLLLIGLSRVYLGVHTPVDVLAGYAAGIFLCGVVGCWK